MSAAAQAGHELVDGHWQQKTVAFDTHYPPHGEREGTAGYERARQKIFDVYGEKCWVCGATDRIETHHFMVEWAESKGVDWDNVFALRDDPNYWDPFGLGQKAKQAGDYAKNPNKAWNLLPLCRKHHRLKGHGIHNLTFPVWILQKEYTDPDVPVRQVA